MALYDRLMGLALPRISIHGFFSAMQEFALGNMTGAQVVAWFGLDANEQTEAQTLLNKILAETNADPVLQSVMRRVKALECEQVLICGQERQPPYTTSAAVKTRLGV